MSDPQSKLKKIIKRVILFHALLLLFMMVHFKPSRKKVLYAKKPLKENVRVIQKKKPQVIAAVKAKSEEKAAPKKVGAKGSPKKVEKTLNKALPKKNSSTITHKNPLPKLEKIPEMPQKDQVEIILPKAIAKLDVEDIEVKEDQEIACGPYAENLSALIDQALSLKPNSYVSIELTLNKKGKVVDIKHLHSSDLLSKDAIMQKITDMEFPDFFGEIASESEYTFVLTLKNKLL